MGGLFDRWWVSKAWRSERIVELAQEVRLLRHAERLRSPTGRALIAVGAAGARQADPGLPRVGQSGGWRRRSWRLVARRRPMLPLVGGLVCAGWAGGASWRAVRGVLALDG